MRDNVYRIIRTAIPEPGRRNLVEAYINSLERELEKTREKSITDELTGVDNRRSFEVALKRMITRALRIQTTATKKDTKPKSIISCITNGWDYPLSCIMADIDHFKNVNDTYGHQTGDIALKFFAEYIRSSLSETDAMGRFGGEEFIIGLEGVSYFDAFNKLSQMRESVKTKKVADQVTLKFSAGISSAEFNPEIALIYNKTILSALRRYIDGKKDAKEIKNIAKRLDSDSDQVATWFENIRTAANDFLAGTKIKSMEDMFVSHRGDFCRFLFIQRADQALYRAKETGRDKVCIWTPDGIIDDINQVKTPNS